MYDDEDEQLNELNKVWPKLSRRQRDIILLAAGLIAIPHKRRPLRPTARGETPHWLALALNILKDSTGQLSDREIAERIGVAHSTLVRNTAYMHAKHVYFQEIRNIVRVGQKIGKLRIQKE